MTDPTERLAEALTVACRIWSSYEAGFRIERDQVQRVADTLGVKLHQLTETQFQSYHLAAQGFGHREDHLREYEKFVEDTTGITMTGDYDGKWWVDRYLASLATKEEEG